MEGRIAVVTGGASGIGLGIARALTARGAKVAVFDVDEEGGKAVAAELEGSSFFPTDLTNSESVGNAVRGANAMGSIDILVNCAGADVIKPFLDTDEELWRWIVDLNLMGVFRTTKAILPMMVERQWGRVVNIASDAGRVGSTGEAVYSGAKGGVIAFTKTIAREVARAGVTVNCVCPGPTDTPATRRTMASGGQDAERLVASLTRSIPLGRLGDPADLGAAVAYLASDEASFVTGQTLSVSGGLTMV